MHPVALGLMAKEGFQSLTKVVQMIRSYQVNTSVSLPQYLKTTSVMSTTYIDETICEEEILLPLMGMLNQLYVAYIFTALQLNQFVSESKTVRNILEFVATEDYTDPIEIINNSFVNPKLVVAQESAFNTVNLESKEQKLLTGRLLELTLNIPSVVSSTTSSVNETKPSASKTTETGSKSINVAIMVQLVPRIITENVAKEFLGLNFTLPKDLRKNQYMAGQITKQDFQKELDLLSNQRKALQEDRTGLLYEMLKNSRNSLSKALLRAVGILPSNVNSANTITIVSQRAIDEIAMSKGFDLSRKNIRDEFFGKSMMMALVIVDVMYQKITLYLNGSEQKGEYSFKMIQANAGAGSQGNDKYDLKDIMGALSNGMVPHFR